MGERRLEEGRLEEITMETNVGVKIITFSLPFFYGTPSYVPAKKLKGLKSDSIKWNTEVFGYVENRKNHLM